jgi:uroporphyrinogen III methyltransferase/synthase
MRGVVAASVADRPLRLGTRGSALALSQANAVAKALGGAEVVPIKTFDQPETGRADAGPRLESGGDKARFVREIERALLDGEVDLGVHSAKDLPTDLPDDLEIAGVLERVDPRDAYIGSVSSLGDVPEGSRIGTSSLRRRAQILVSKPDLDVVGIRSSIDTRLEKLRGGEFDGLILAAAGLHRLDRAAEISFALDYDEMLPAPGQGVIAIEAMGSKIRPITVAESIADRGVLGTLSAERALASALGASCNTPLGATATLEHGGRMRLRAFCGLWDGSDWLRDELEADASVPEDLGSALAERMKSAGPSTSWAGRADGGRNMSANPGIVYLVGAGPGDPGLMTTRSLELIVAADAIVHDRLIPRDALALARPAAELIYVGKEPGAASVPQEGIAELLIDRARQGNLVVRLKGGDPFVFGRGGEEAEALADAEIPFEVVPGITAGIAAPPTPASRHLPRRRPAVASSPGTRP